VKFGDPEYGQDGMIVCPRCGSVNLHHRTVHVYTRPMEDADGIHVETGCYSIDGGAAWKSGKSVIGVSAAPEAAFLGRRDDIRIEFWCESCSQSEDDTFLLLVVQHKGVTFIEWSADATPGAVRHA